MNHYEKGRDYDLRASKNAMNDVEMKEDIGMIQ